MIQMMPNNWLFIFSLINLINMIFIIKYKKKTNKTKILMKKK